MTHVSDTVVEMRSKVLARLMDSRDLRVYPESPHGFTLHPTSMARAAVGDIDAWLVDRLGQKTGVHSDR